jgi:undecaprenyl-diphosphatase
MLKGLFARDRPTVRPFVEPVSRFSFPSGHAVASMALACVVVVLGWSTRGRGLALAGAILYVALVGATQITLGVHFPSDLLAAWLLALAVITLLAAALCRWGRLSR